MRKKDKKKLKYALIYLRYILPPILMLLVLATLFIPSYRYVIAGEIDDNISGFSLIHTSFEEVRKVIFATGEQDAGELLFSRIVFGLLIGFVILWIVGFASAVYSAIVALSYFLGNDEEALEKSRTLFITFFPNRIFLSIVQTFILPIALFAYALIPIYDGIWGIRVAVVLTAPDAFIFTLVILATIFILSAITAPWERRFDADLFKKKKRIVAESNDEVDEDALERENTKAKVYDKEKIAKIRSIFESEDKQ